MKKIILKVIVASVFFLGLLPLLLAWRENAIFHAILFLASVAGYAIAEVVMGTRKDVRAKRIGGLANMLFLAILFLSLGILLKRWVDAQWTDQLQTGFFMLSATYYSVTLMQLCFLRE